MEINIRSNLGKKEIFDPIRKKWLQASPEEFVRQELIVKLINAEVPKHWIAVEKEISYFNLKKRFDLIIARPTDQKILLLAECKAPEVEISKQTFEQIANYHAILKPHWWLLTNGNQLYVIQPAQAIFLQELPNFNFLCQDF